VGSPFDGKVREGVIYRLAKVPQQPVKYQYLTVSDYPNGSADVLMIKDFRRGQEKLKKKVKKGTGLEVLIAPVRKLDAAAVARWFETVSELYSFCHSSRCQLVLSSGATSINEMVSGPSMDAILKNCGIDPESYWREMNDWFEAELSRRVHV
jgi:hypothetical protein